MSPIADANSPEKIIDYLVFKKDREEILKLFNDVLYGEAIENSKIILKARNQKKLLPMQPIFLSLWDAEEKQ